jgi:hypothetical protein
MKIFNKFFWAFCFLTAMMSCEKKLTDLQPIDVVPADRAILNMNDMLSAVNGVYGTWIARTSVYTSALISDEVRLGTGSGYRNVGNQLFNWQFASDAQDWRDDGSGLGYMWSNLYQVIDRANRVIQYGANVPVSSPADQALKDQYTGEMLALRAMAHLELLRCYSATAEYNPTALGVVLQTSYVTNPATYRPTRNTQLEVVTQVNADLAQARTMIPTTFTDISRITRNAVIAGQVRAAMFTKQWQNVIDRASEIIPLQPLTNIAGYPALWTTHTLAVNQSTEVIWKLNVTSANSGSAIGSLWQDANGATQATPAAKLTNMYNQATDVRFATFFRLNPPANLIAKYGVIPPTTENFLYDIKMIRTSEIVLARAEAYAELSMFTQSNADLASVRTNRITGYVHTALPDEPTLIDAIYTERYKELCYEGQRYFDLRRRSMPIVRDVSDIAGISSSQTLLPTDGHYLLPIPAQEVQANPNITQNPGY